jgi:O-antigen/teichoic acid export membrane protein
VLVTVLTLAVTARWLGPEGRGHFAAVSAWAATAAACVGFSLNSVVVRRLAVQASSDGSLRAAADVMALAAMALGALGAAALGVLFLVSGGTLFGSIPAAYMLVGAVLVPLLLWEQYAVALLTSADRLSAYNRALVFGRTAGLGLLFVLFHGFGLGVGAALGAVLAGQLVILYASVRALGLRWPRLANSGRALRSYLVDGAKLHFNTVGTLLFMYVDVLMLNYFAAPAETGQYQLGVQLLALLLILPQAVATIFYGKVAQQGADEAWRSQRVFIAITMAIVLALAALLALTVSRWLPLIVGGGFEKAESLFRLQLIGVAGMALSALLAPQWIGRGYFVLAAQLTLAVGLVSCTVNWLLIPTLGALGAVYAGILTGLISIVGNGAMIVHCNRKWHESVRSPAAAMAGSL